MILLIDAGNTRIKWCVLDGGARIADGALFHADLHRLADVLPSDLKLTRTLGANVAGTDIARRIAETLQPSGTDIEWITPSADCSGVRNAYAQPERLGADRWAALIGARSLHQGAALVVMAGTATTIDMLTPGGDFIGGVILPGEYLMRQALARHTAQLELSDGAVVTAPCTTADAIVSGCREAQLGAIERMFARIAKLPGAQCLLGGGGAESLAADLALPVLRVDDLVLRGLACIAAQPSNRH